MISWYFFLFFMKNQHYNSIFHGKFFSISESFFVRCGFVVVVTIPALHALRNTCKFSYHYTIINRLKRVFAPRQTDD